MKPTMDIACPWLPEQTTTAKKARAKKQKPSDFDPSIVQREFNTHYSVADILERNSYIRKGHGKWLAPNSSSGIPGVLLQRDGEHIISYHGSDPLGDGKPHDAYSCFVILEHRGDTQAAWHDVAIDLGIKKPVKKKRVNGKHHKQVVETKGIKIPELNLKRNHLNRVENNTHNIYEILLKHPEWKGVLGFDEFSLRVSKRKAPPFIYGKTGIWQDTDNTGTRMWIYNHFGFEPSVSIVQEVVEYTAQEQVFHPVRDYLQLLKWDGNPRVMRWAEKYLGAEETPANRTFQKCFLIGAIARVMQPGCKMDTVLILEGKQGHGKSTALQVLFSDEWFTDAAFELGSKDGFIIMRGKWCIELAELDKFKKAEASKAKAFFSQRKDEYRMPYAHNSITPPRQCVFAGTVNPSDYLNDATGGRRFMPIEVSKINLDALAHYRDQLWAEAYYLYQAGENWWYCKDLLILYYRKI
jgi:predicted P-loop ATPase